MGDSGGRAGIARGRPEVLIELDERGHVSTVAPSASGHVQGPPAPGTGPTALLMLVHPDDRDRAYAIAEALRAAPPGVAAAATLRVRSPQGPWRELAVHARRHRGGAVLGVSPWPVPPLDAAAALDRLRTPAASIAADGRFDGANDELCDLLGYDRAELRRRWPGALVHPADADRSAALDRLVAAGAEHAEADVRWLRAEGTAVPATEHRVLVPADGAVIVELLVTAAATTPLGVGDREGADLAVALVDAVPTMLVAVDATGVVVRANNAAGSTAGSSPDELADRAVDDVFPSPTGEATLRKLTERAMALGAPATEETRFAAPDGALRVLEWTASPLHPPVGRAAAVLAAVDVTERQAALAAISFKALHDPLTRLPNRALLHERLSHAISRLGRTDDELAVLFLDLNHFKEVNDRFGHDAGDRLLAALAERFRAAVRPSDTVARIGGDEFVVLCEDLPDGASALAIVDRLVDAVEQPFTVDDSEVTVSVAVGIAFARHTGTDAEALIRQADAAMYDAKRRGAVTAQPPAPTPGPPGNERIAPAVDEAELRTAVESGGVVVLYQPQIALPGGELTGVEALVRIRHPDGGLLTPASFLAVAERTGLIVPIGVQVIRDVCRRAASWRRVAPTLRVTVNLSARELAAEDAAAGLAEALRETGLDPDAIVVDIREDVLLTGEATALATLRTLKAAGVRLSVDDAGLRFATSQDVLTLGLDEVKVAGGHVQGIGRGSDGEPVVASIVRLARSLDLRTVAEGVETEHQLAELRALGCDAGQGYLFAPPQPAEVIDRLVGPGLRWRTDVAPGEGSRPS